MVPPRPDILAQVKQIIRADLKLGPEEVIADDMPLIGGDLDLDSLDVLLLLTSMEKRFGIKVSSKSVGQTIFQSVATLAAYIDEHHAADRVGGAEADLDAALSNLPHGEGFRFLSHLTDLRPGERGAAVWNLKGDEPFFAGHFPSGPVVPGVLIAEALAQLSGLVAAPAGAGEAEGPGKVEGRLAHVDIRYRRTVTPPVKVELISRQAKAMGELHQFEVEARVAGRVVAEGSLALHVTGEGS